MLFINGARGRVARPRSACCSASLEQHAYARRRGRRPIDRSNVRIAVRSAYRASSAARRCARELLSHLSVVVIARAAAARIRARTCPSCCATTSTGWSTTSSLPFRRFSVAAQNRLRNYPWPGNVRELKNLRAAAADPRRRRGDPLEEIERELAAQAPTDEPLVKQDLLALPLREAREHFERAYLQQQLQLCSGKVGQLAKRVGMERTHLYRKLRSLGVDFRQSLTDD